METKKLSQEAQAFYDLLAEAKKRTNFSPLSATQEGAFKSEIYATAEHAQTILSMLYELNQPKQNIEPKSRAISLNQFAVNVQGNELRYTL